MDVHIGVYLHIEVREKKRKAIGKVCPNGCNSDHYIPSMAAVYCAICGNKLSVSSDESFSYYPILWDLLKLSKQESNEIEPFFEIGQENGTIIAGGNFVERANGTYEIDCNTSGVTYNINPKDIPKLVNDFKESYKTELNALKDHPDVESVQVLFGAAYYP